MKKIEENDEKTIQNNNTIRYKKGGRAIKNRIWTFASSKINEYLTADYTNEKEGDLKYYTEPIIYSREKILKRNP